jgi:hemoglobin-like flavoprotein
MPTATLSDQQRDLVAQSFALLVPISDQAATLFYERLWALAPETRAMFGTTDMAAQRMKLMQTLGMAVRALHNIEEVAPLMLDLGKRHLDYGVTRAQYAYVKTALLGMIAHCMGDEYTPEIDAAWNAAYDLIATMATRVYD